MLRETFIALRARRTGHRIAREILNPPMPERASPQKEHPFSRTPLRAWPPSFLNDPCTRLEEKLEDAENVLFRIFWIVMGVVFLLLLALILFVHWQTRMG